MKFKYGDIARVNQGFYEGLEGILEEYSEDTNTYILSTENGDLPLFVREEEITKVEES